MQHRRTRRLGALAAATVVAVSGLAAGTTTAEAAGGCKTLWVSPDGSDTAAGTEKAPFASLDRARDQIRDKKLNQHLRCDLVVNVKSGEYAVDSTFELDERDSGSNGHDVVYRSVDGPGTAVLSGADELTGWEPVGDGIYKTQVEEGRRFYTLFEDGERAEVARYPNRGSEDSHGPYLFSRLGEPEKEAVRQWLYWEEGDWDPAWDDTPTSNPLANAQLTVWSGGSWSWFTDTVPIGGADYRKGFTTLNYWTRYALMNSRSGSRYFIQNAMPFLDQAGEYYFDFVNNEIYYKPKGDIGQVRILAPTVKKLIDVKGTSPEQRAHDITFDGIGLQHSDFVNWYRAGWISAGDSGEPHKYPEYDRQIEMPRNRFGAVTIENTKDVTLTNLHVSDTGFMGVYALFANEGLKVTNSLFENIGADAIKIEGGYPGEGDLSHGHTISNVFIDHVGELVPGDAAGIEMMGTGDNVVEHVFVNHSARYGISLESRPEVKDGDQYTDNNAFRYIEIQNAGLDSGDMGAFYTYGVENQEPYPVQNTVEQMVIGDVLNDPIGTMPDSGTRGIHMDAGGCGFRFSNITVGATSDQSYQAYKCNEVVNGDWEAGFDDSKMEYDKIGVTAEFPYDVTAQIAAARS